MNFPALLRCSMCDWSSAIGALRNLCPACNAPVVVRYDIQPDPELRARIRCRARGMWRWSEVLPPVPPAEVVTLGEGDTPLLAAPRLGRALGMTNLLVKDESLNPTRSFKARGMAAAVTMARRLGAERLAAPTAGNAGSALAAYGARAGLPIFIAMPDDTPSSMIDECRSYGAEVELVRGVITDAGRRVQEVLRERGGFDLSTLKEPYRVEGKKTMAYELVEQLGGVPDAILYPTGGGTGLIGMWKAFAEMEQLGWIGSERPRMFSIQSRGCAPIVRAFEQGLDTAPEWEHPRTAAWGLRVPRAVGDRLMLAALRASGGGAVAVPEETIEPAAAEIREREGIDAGPEGGAALAGLRILLERAALPRDAQVVLFNTGANKYR
ncbi:MAG TPA: threonine synthase [Thermoanaerobaculia bacterium]